MQLKKINKRNTLKSLYSRLIDFDNFIRKLNPGLNLSNNSNLNSTNPHNFDNLDLKN